MGTIIIAIGGPSGAGKTAVVKRMKELMPETIITHPAFTTRPQRPDEQEGIDYHFKTVTDLDIARQDPAFADFVEARGYWYWTAPDRMLREVSSHPHKLHIFFVSQRKDYENRKTNFPDLRWVWLYADTHEIEMRLSSRVGESAASSLEYNHNLSEQRVNDLIDLRIHNREGQLDRTAQRILEFCESLP